MEWSLTVLLPIGLGLFGFVEPCAVGGHMVVLGALADQTLSKRIVSMGLFVATRTLTLGVIGMLVALIGQQFIAGQKAFWLLFGIVYVGLGGLYLLGRVGALMRRIGLPRHFMHDRQGAVMLGIIFGLSVPACAAPLLFAVAASAAGAQAYLNGFVSMGLFGLALSAPLLVGAVPQLSRVLARMPGAPTWLRRTLGGLLIGLGLWSIWFGLFVNPADWQLS